MSQTQQTTKTPSIFTTEYDIAHNWLESFPMKRDMMKLAVNVHLMNKLIYLTHRQNKVFREYKTLGHETNAVWCDKCNKLSIEEAHEKHIESVHEHVANGFVHPDCTVAIKGWSTPRCFASDYGCEVCGNLVI